MSLEPVESNEHSIRFKVLEEVPLAAVVERILRNADGALSGDPDDAASGGRARALELLQIGAVYVGIPHKGMDHINWVRSTDLPGAVTAASVPAGQYIRVHPHPKRYPACQCTDWPSRILHSDEEYLVVNKPAGLPCMRHESNAVEELACCVGRALGLPGLEVCHRLDQSTTGIVVLSRTKEANRTFKRALQDREAGLTKTYKALSYSPVPLGPLEHHMYDGPFNDGSPVLDGGSLRSRGPRLLSRTAHERWRLCRLEVTECREHAGALEWYNRLFSGLDSDAAWLAAPAAIRQLHSVGGAQTSAPQEPRQHEAPGVGDDEARGLAAAAVSLAAVSLAAVSLAGGSAGAAGATTQQQQTQSSTPPVSSPARPVRLYESTIDLHTGRTHQIRAQLASEGCPLVGDIMYAPLTGLLVDDSGVLRDPATVSLVEQLPMVDGHIGLHAWRLRWRGRVFEAQPDWGPE